MPDSTILTKTIEEDGLEWEINETGDFVASNDTYHYYMPEKYLVDLEVIES